MDRRDFLKAALLLGGVAFSGNAWRGLTDAFAAEGGSDAGVKRVHGLYFSPTETTKTVVGKMLEGFSSPVTRYDLLRRPLHSRLNIGKGELAIVGVPVYSGRVPPLVLQSLKNLKGDNTPAIAVVLYGNRDYDDALLELKDTLESNGFVVVAGAAFIGQHAIFPRVASGRPDKEDLEAVSKFTAQCAALVAAHDANADRAALLVKGNKPYREPPPTGIQPSIDDACTACNTCAVVCPTKALRLDRKTRKIVRDEKKCISCAACIHFCPSGAQAFRGEQYEAFGKMFEEKFSKRLEPDMFL